MKSAMVFNPKRRAMDQAHAPREWIVTDAAENPGPLPLILVVDADESDREGARAAISRRFGADYDVRAVASAAEALVLLRDRVARGYPVAIVAADLDLADMDGVRLLEHVHAVDKRLPGS